MCSVSSHIPMLLVGVVNWVHAICKNVSADSGGFRAAKVTRAGNRRAAELL